MTLAASPANRLLGALRRMVTAGPSGVAVGMLLLALALSLSTRTFATAENLKVIALGAAVTVVVGLA